MASSPPTFDELQKMKKKWKIRDVTLGVDDKVYKLPNKGC